MATQMKLTAISQDMQYYLWGREIAILIKVCHRPSPKHAMIIVS